MKVVKLLVSCLASAVVLGLPFAAANTGGPLNVVCTLRGKKYNVEAASVSDVRAALEEQAGLEQDKQGILFKGKKLGDEQSLEEAGVSHGDIINVVPQKTPKRAAQPQGTAAAAPSDAMPFADVSDGEDDGMGSGVGAAGSTGAQSDMFGNMGALKDAMKDVDMDSMLQAFGGEEGLKSMLKQFGLDGPLTPDKIEKVMEQIKQMFENPALKQLFSDPEILEQSRQQIIGNPMLMNAYESMGMGELIRDPEAFRGKMMAFKELLENPETLSNLSNALLAATKMNGANVDEFDEGEL